MHVKTHPPVTILYSTHQTSIQQLSDFVGVVMKDLCAEAVSNNALISGPPCWIYHGMDGKPNTIFTLEIAIAVQGEIKSTRFPTKQLPAFKAVTYTHEGSWSSMPQAYGQIMHHIDANKIPMNEECREYYLNIDFQNPENNITQIQVGVV
jgi:effector-binding domain-containing protein